MSNPRRSRFPQSVLVASAVLFFSVELPSFAADFFLDDFESYATDADVTAAGWIISDTAAAIEASTWTITNPGGRGNPATADGSPSTGGFMISDSDAQGESNPTDSGASHDLATPVFSTAGAAGDVWLHVDTSAILNNNGAAVYDIDVSTDGGANWTNQFRRVAPGRVSSNSATTVLPDNTNTDGYFGQLDVNLGAIGGQSEVSVRFRHFEPNFDWFIGIDNVRVDDVAPSQGAVELFAEDFNSMTLGAMLSDGLNAGTTDGWTNRDGEKGNRYTAGQIGERDVNRLMHSDPEGRDGMVSFAIVDSDADPDPLQDEYLMTPVMDLTGMAEVFLHYDSEIVALGDANEVLVMQDANGDGADSGDAVLGTAFNYLSGALLDSGEEPLYAQRILDVSSLAAGQDDVFFAFHFAGQDEWWWAVDNVRVSANPVPEPSALALIIVAACGLAGRMRRRQPG